MWLIVGLGNPGASYAGTRHNVGFAVIDALADRWGIKAWQGKFGGKAAVVDAAGRTVLLLKPWTYMNRSGDSVAVAMGFYKLPLDHLMVVLDDMALEPGRIRLRPGLGRGPSRSGRYPAEARDRPGSSLPRGDWRRARPGWGRLRAVQTGGRGADAPGLGRGAIPRCDSVLAGVRHGEGDDGLQSGSGGCGQGCAE